jgi:Bacterial regulatory proteins, luxR family
MAMALTKDERLVLRYIASGRSTEEIAATLNWPLQAVRWTCAHPLTAWVLDELEASTTSAHSPGAGSDVSQGRAIVDYLWGSARRRARRTTRD